MPAPALPYRIIDADDDLVAGFIKWTGTPPTLVQKQLQTPSRPGYRNVGLLDTGNRLPPHEVEVESWFEDLEDGYDSHAAVVALIGVLPPLQLVWADIELTDFNQKIVLLGVQLVSCRMHPQLFAPKWGLEYSPGCRLVQRLKIQYFEVDPPPPPP
jgi:hypothetical protein